SRAETLRADALPCRRVRIIDCPIKLFFTLDTSESIALQESPPGSLVDNIREFTKIFVHRLADEEYKGQIEITWSIGGLHFSQRQIVFSQFTTKENFIRNLGKITYLGKGTYIDCALKNMTAEMTRHYSGTKAVLFSVVITDGHATGSPCGGVKCYEHKCFETPGIPGPKGLPGPKGAKGDRGLVGTKGHRGRLGEVGFKGDKGEFGAIGAKGKMGRIGAPGCKGDPGDKGPNGFHGEFGETGPPGDKGEKGDHGHPGKSGLSGPRGSPGSKGERGNPGNPGPPGNKGSQGRRGDPGQKGAPGTDGIKGEKGHREAEVDPEKTDSRVQRVPGEIQEMLDQGATLDLLDLGETREDKDSAILDREDPLETEVIRAEEDRGGAEVTVVPKESLETKDHQENLGTQVHQVSQETEDSEENVELMVALDQ
ncbi:hypothetical protein INR49_005294, partial [Caranx melampygus]